MKNNNLYMLHKQELYKELWKARFFTLCPNYRKKTPLDFYYYLW